MSLILDALRKMEQERRTRRGGAQDLRPDVLRYRTAEQPKESSRLPQLLAGGAILLLCGLGGGLFLSGGSDSEELQAKQDIPSSSVSAAAPVPPVAPEPAPAPAAVPAAATTPAGPAYPVASGAAPVPLQAVRPVEVKPRQSTPQAPPAPSPAAGDPVAPAAAANTGDIVISGIAYQDERRMRRAVLNGQLVGEGEEIAGARVVEIKETKVRLSRRGQVFEVPFSAGLQAR